MCVNLVGVAIGGGWQSLVAYINLGSYYGFGLPLGFLLGYIANLGVMVINYLMLKAHLKKKKLQIVFLIILITYICSYNMKREFGEA